MSFLSNMLYGVSVLCIYYVYGLDDFYAILSSGLWTVHYPPSTSQRCGKEQQDQGLIRVKY